MLTKQARDEARTLRLGAPIKSCSLTREDLKLAYFFLVEAWISSNDSNTGTNSSNAGHDLHRLRNQTTQLLTQCQMWQMDCKGNVEHILYRRGPMYHHHELVLALNTIHKKVAA